ncbi:MAG: FAD:protein FMN transferase [Gammaproteobacteria bacterium]
MHTHRRRLEAVFIALLLCGCQQREISVHEFQFFALGTLIELTIADAESRSAQRAYRRIEKDFKMLDKDLYPWREGALARTNRLLATGQSFTVDPSLVPMIEEATRLSRLSEGLFNPAIGALVEFWGFTGGEPPRIPPPRKDIMRLVARQPSMQALVFAGPTLKSTNNTLRLDFGGYAKGYAVDRGVEALRALGIRNAILNAGGDLRAFGRRGIRPWHIGIRHPRSPEVFASVEVETDESILTSGDYERFFIYNRKRYHHVIDPRTGYPARGAVCATVIHRSAAVGDATATALLVAGPDHWEALARAMGIDQAMLVDTAGNVHVTPKLRDRIRFHVDPGRRIFTSGDP